MTVESKIIVTAEDRTRAALASIERNAGKTATAVSKLGSTVLKLAGAGTALNFFRHGAESTEKWRDEMARLDDITKKFFNTAADSGKLDPLIGTIKTIHLALFGISTAIDNVAKGTGAVLAAQLAAMKLNFGEARRALKEYVADSAEDSKFLKKLYLDISAGAPQGYAKHREEEADRTKNAAEKLKKATVLRHQAIKDSEAEDIFRAESEISEGYTREGLSLVGKGVYDEARAEEARKLLDAAKHRVAETDRSFAAGFKKAGEDIVGYATDTATQVHSLFAGAFYRMEDALVQFVMTGKASFKDFTNSVLADMARIAIQQMIIAPLAGAMFGGARAAGGPVSADTAYLVGERGPELFVPNTSGSIVPNGGGGANVQVNVINQTGQPASAQASQPRFDGEKYIVDVIMRNLDSNGPLRGAIAGAR